jgi:Protein of unknown function (DUF3085)
MGVCKFKVSEVLRCVTHSVTNTTDDGFSVPSIILVHDSGVYIMSNASPADLEGPRSYVAYAEGCDPSKDYDYYQTARSLVGGDDFGEIIKLDESTLSNFASYEDLSVLVNDSNIEFTFSNPNSKKVPESLAGLCSSLETALKNANYIE